MGNVVHIYSGSRSASTAEVYPRHSHRPTGRDLQGELRHPLTKSFCLRDAMMITKYIYKTFDSLKMDVQCFKLFKIK